MSYVRICPFDDKLLQRRQDRSEDNHSYILRRSIRSLSKSKYQPIVMLNKNTYIKLYINELLAKEDCMYDSLHSEIDLGIFEIKLEDD